MMEEYDSVDEYLISSSNEEFNPCNFYSETEGGGDEYFDPSCLPTGLRLSINRKTKLDLLTEKIERPNGGVPPNHLPMWPKYPLCQKLPNITAPCGLMYYSKGKIGEHLERNYLDWHAEEFCLTPSHNYSALHDPYVANYFIKPTVINQLVKLGLITKDGHVVCTLKELNVYRKYLDTVFKDKVKQMIKDKDRAWLYNFKMMRKLHQYNSLKDPEKYKAKLDQARSHKEEEYIRRLINYKEKQKRDEERSCKYHLELEQQYLEHMILSKEKEDKVILRKLELENLENQHRERIMNHIICKEKTSEVRRLTLKELMKDAYNRYLKEFIDAKWESQNERMKCEEIIERSIREDLKRRAAYRQSFMENQWNTIPKINEKRHIREERRMNLVRKYFYIWLDKTRERRKTRLAKNQESSWDIESSIKSTNTDMKDELEIEYEMENMQDLVWRAAGHKMNYRKVPNKNSLYEVPKDKIPNSHRSNRKPRDKTFVPESCHTHKTITSLAERKNAARVEAETITTGMRNICTSELNQGNAVVLKIPIGQLICPDNELKQIKIVKSPICDINEKNKAFKRLERKRSPLTPCSRKFEPRSTQSILNIPAACSELRQSKTPLKCPKTPMKKDPYSPRQKKHSPEGRNIVKTPPIAINKTNVKTPPARATAAPIPSKTSIKTKPKEPIQPLKKSQSVKSPEKIIPQPGNRPEKDEPKIQGENISKSPSIGIVKSHSPPQTPEEDESPKILPKSPEKSPFIENLPEIEKDTPSEPSLVIEEEEFSIPEPVIEENPTTPEEPSKNESDEPTEEISKEPSESSLKSSKGPSETSLKSSKGPSETSLKSLEDEPEKENPQTPEVKSSEKLLIEPSENIPSEPSSSTVLESPTNKEKEPEEESPKEPEKSESPKKPIEQERRESPKIEPQIESIEEEPSEPETDEESLKPEEPETDEESLKPIKSTGEIPKNPNESEINIPSNIESPLILSEKPSKLEFEIPEDFQEPTEEEPKITEPEKVQKEPSQDDLKDSPKIPSELEFIKKPNEPERESPKEPEKSESPKKPIEPESRESLKIEPQIESIEEEPSKPETDQDSLKPVKSTGESPKKPNESEINIPSNIESPVILSKKPSQIESEAPEEPSNEDFQEPIEEYPKLIEPQEVQKEPSQDDLKDPSEPEIIKEPIEPEELSPIIEPNDHPNEENEQEKRKIESPAEEPNKPKENVLKTPSQEEPKQTEPEATEDEPIKELSKKPSIENAPTQPKSEYENPPESLDEPFQQPVKKEFEEEKPENIPSENEESEPEVERPESIKEPEREKSELIPPEESNEFSPDEPIEGIGEIPPIIPCKDDEPCCTDSEIDRIANDLVRRAIERERQKLKDQICPGCTNDEIDDIANRLVNDILDKVKKEICKEIPLKSPCKDPEASPCTDREIDRIAKELVHKAIEKEKQKLKDNLCPEETDKEKDAICCTDDEIDSIANRLVRKAIEKESKKLEDQLNKVAKAKDICGINDLLNEQNISPVASALVRRIICQEYKKLCPDKSHVNLLSPNYQECVEDIVNQMAINAIPKAIKDVKIDKKASLIAREVLCDSIRELNKDDGHNENLQNAETNIELERLKKKCCTKSCIIEEECIDLRSFCMTDEAIEKAVEKQKQIVYEKTLKEIQEYIKNETANSSSSGLSSEKPSQFEVPEKPNNEDFQEPIEEKPKVMEPKEVQKEPSQDDLKDPSEHEIIKEPIEPEELSPIIEPNDQIPYKDDEPCTDSEIDRIANDLVRREIERERQKIKNQICPGCTNDEIDSIAYHLVRKVIEKERDKLKDQLNKVAKAKDTCEINDLLNEQNISPVASALVRRIICQEYKKLCPDKSHVNLFSPNYQECVEDIVNQMAINAISKAIKDVKIDKKGTIIAHQVMCDSIRELNKDDGLNENLQNTEINIELERLKKKCCTKSCIIEEECIDLRSICMTDEAIEKAVEKQKQIVYEKTLKEIQEYIKNETANSSSSGLSSDQSSTQILIPENKRPQLSSKCESGEITPTQSEFKEMISKDNKEAERTKQNSQSQAQPENSSDIDRRDTKTQLQDLAEQVVLLRKDLETLQKTCCKKENEKDGEKETKN